MKLLAEIFHFLEDKAPEGTKAKYRRICLALLSPTDRALLLCYSLGDVSDRELIELLDRSYVFTESTYEGLHGTNTMEWARDVVSGED